MRGFRTWFTVPFPDRAVRHWHVAPALDVAAYGWSWLWVLVPLCAWGPAKTDYYVLYLFILGMTEVHRHFGLPYVYMDKEVFRRFPLRFALVPLVFVAAWLISPWAARYVAPWSAVELAGLMGWVVVLTQVLRRDDGVSTLQLRWIALAFVPAVAIVVVGELFAGFAGFAGGKSLESFVGWWWLAGALVASLGLDVSRGSGRGSFFAPVTMVALVLMAALAPNMGYTPIRTRVLLNMIAVVAGVWNIWHVLMQKYGIFRLYNAKNGQPRNVPGWVDRWFVWGWLPLWVLWLGPTYRDVVLTGFPRGTAMLGPMIDALVRAQPYLLGPSVVLVVLGHALFVVHEWRANKLRNAPRLWMASGTTALSLCFFFVHPFKVYIAYAFSHAIEYMVFVWAFQRRRYHKPLPHQPMLGAVLRKPWLAYGGFVVVGLALVLILKYYGRTIFKDHQAPYFLGLTTAEWFMYWSVYQSMMHFYYDGFLWKMRQRTNQMHL